VKMKYVIPVLLAVSLLFPAGPLAIAQARVIRLPPGTILAHFVVEGKNTPAFDENGRPNGVLIQVAGVGGGAAGHTGTRRSEVSLDIAVNGTVVDVGQPILMGDEIALNIAGLAGGQEATIHTRQMDPRGELRYARAAYRAGGDGQISTAESNATAGSYSGVNPPGLFWSMQLITDTATLPDLLPRLPENRPDHTTTYFDVEADAKIEASAHIKTIAILPDVARDDVTDNDLMAHFYHPTGKDNLPAVIIVSGSDGGIAVSDSIADLLASKGYAALSLAYFGMPGLPNELEEIPLGYFGKAIDWVSQQDIVDKDSLAVLGFSKGGELVLLLGATYPQINAVVAISPSHVAWQGLSQDQSKVASSWTHQGKPVPFVPFVANEDFTKQFAHGIPAKIEYLPLYVDSLKDEDAVEKAIIHVENIQGPILLASGGDDKMWPARFMSEQVVNRLQEQNFAHPVHHFNYDDAGHLFGVPGYIPNRDVPFVRGGTPAGNGIAQAELWNRSLQFLNENLKPRAGKYTPCLSTR